MQKRGKGHGGTSTSGPADVDVRICLVMGTGSTIAPSLVSLTGKTLLPAKDRGPL